MVITSLLGNEISKLVKLRTLMPGECLFVVCYLLYYAAHSCLNAILKSMNKSRLLLLNIVMYSYTFSSRSMFVTTMFPAMSIILGSWAFCPIFRYNAREKNMPVFSASKQRNLVLLFCGIVGQLCLLMVSNRMGLSGHLADGMTRWDTLINPFSFIIAIGGFNLAKHWKQENKTINHLSGLSLRVYLFHANRYMRTIIMPQMINEWAESIPPPPRRFCSRC